MNSDNCWICGFGVSPEDNFCRVCGAELTHDAEPKLKASSPSRHLSIGIFLSVFGAATAVVSFLIGVVPILALGLSALLVGIMTLYLHEPERRFAERLAGDSSIPAMLNVENLLEDLSLNEKGIYIPASGLGICPKVFVPLTRTPTSSKPPKNLNDSNRIFINLDDKGREGGLLLEAPGRNLLSELELALGVDLARVETSDLGRKLGAGLKFLEISNSVVLESQPPRTFALEIQLIGLGNLEAKLPILTPRVANQIGTPVSSAVAASLSKSTGEYVVFKKISFQSADKKITAQLELL